MLTAESKKAVPDAALLGAKAARIETICRESIALRAGLQDALPKLLTGLQLTRWQELPKAVQLLPVLSEAQSLNLGGPPASKALMPFFIRLAAARATGVFRLLLGQHSLTTGLRN